MSEDNKVTQRTITIFLQKQRFQMVEANDGQQALSIIDTRHPDLVLMDISMPVMDGCTACGEINKKSQETGPPVIMITAFEEAEAVEKVFAAVVNPVISTPDRSILKFSASYLFPHYR